VAELRGALIAIHPKPRPPSDFQALRVSGLLRESRNPSTSLTLLRVQALEAQMKVKERQIVKLLEGFVERVSGHDTMVRALVRQPPKPRALLNRHSLCM
jgi:hypothetical protein